MRHMIEIESRGKIDVEYGVYVRGDPAMDRIGERKTKGILCVNASTDAWLEYNRASPLSNRTDGAVVAPDDELITASFYHMGDRPRKMEEHMNILTVDTWDDCFSILFGEKPRPSTPHKPL